MTAAIGHRRAASYFSHQPKKHKLLLLLLLLLLVDFPPFNKEHPVKLVFNLKFPKLKSYHNFGINVVSIVYNKNPVTLKFDKNVVPGPVTMYMYLHV